MGNKDYTQQKEITELPLLHMELDESHTKFNLKLKGDPVIVCGMIANAMDEKQDIAGVMLWCNRNNINPDELKNMVKFH